MLKKGEGFFSGRTSRKKTTCGASHQLLVGIPVIFIRQPGKIAVRAFPLHIHGEQLPCQNNLIFGNRLWKNT
jgi:hypothetical protein